MHFLNTGSFAIQQFLTKNSYSMILMRKFMQILQFPNHTFCVSENHHIRNFGTGVPPCNSESGNPVCQKPKRRIDIGKFPSTLCSNGVRFCFNGVIFCKLCTQCVSSIRLHGGIQYAADTDLAHLCRLQKRRQKFLAGFHNISPLLSCT